MLPIKDSVPTRTTPILTIALIAANVLVWILYEDAGQSPGYEAAINELAYHPCEVENTCGQVGEDWPITAFTSMFMHADWLHLLGNMLFLWIFGNNIEDLLGRVRFVKSPTWARAARSRACSGPTSSFFPEAAC